MSATCRFSHRSLTADGVVLATLLFGGAHVQAQTVACAKNTVSTLSQNGIVAPGAAGMCGAVGPVWPTVAPLEMVPNGSTPDGYLYLAYNPSATVKGSTSQRLYIGVTSKGDPDVSNNDDIVVVFHSLNNADFATGDFYIRVPVIASNADIASGVACSQAVGTIDYFKFLTGTGWQHEDDSAVVDKIDAHAAYRYDAGNQVWNLEIDMPISLSINGTTYFDLPATVNADPTKRTFGLGAYYFISQGNPPIGLNPKPLKWPATMPDRHSYTDQQMQSLFTPLAASQLGNVSLSNGCFDVTVDVTSWDIGGAAAKENDHKVVRNAVNTFGVTVKYTGPGNAPGDLTNNGNLKLSLVPYGAWAPTHDPWDLTQAVSLPTFNAVKRFTFDYDFANQGVCPVPIPPGIIACKSANWAPYQPLGFVCATYSLSGFAHDDNTTNNSYNVNYNYFTTSDYTNHFLVSGDDVANLNPGESGSMYLRLQAANEVAGAFTFPEFRLLGPRPWQLTTLAAFATLLLASMLLVAASRGLLTRRQRRSGIAFALIAISVLVYAGCRRKPLPGNGRWQVQNATELGLTPVQGEPDLYQLPIKRGEVKRVDLLFTGRQLPYTPVRQRLAPATADGQPGILRVPVKPGQVVTVLGIGNIRLDGPNGTLPPASPMGIIVGEARATTTVAAARADYLLRSSVYSPNEYAGAVIGSFDNFERGFVVGRSSSIVIPADVNTLSLAVNAIRGQYAQITGDYEIIVITTPQPQVPTYTAVQGDATGHIVPSVYPIWNVLTSLQVYSYYETRFTDPGGRVSRTLNPIGAVHYSVYESH